MLTANDVVRYAEAAPDRPRPQGIAVVLGVAAGSALLTRLASIRHTETITARIRERGIDPSRVAAL